MIRRLAMLVPPLLLAACATSSVEVPAGNTLIGASGAPTGSVQVISGTAGLMLRLEASGLTPGTHGVHVHAVGKCEGPEFTSAGGHWNPAGKQHGHMNPAGPHAGDLGNITVGADGRVSTTLQLAGATADSLHDADGSALVVHAAADDEMSDPSGNSGARIACALL